MKLRQFILRLNLLTLWLVGSIIAGVEFYILDYFFTKDPNVINAIAAGVVFGLIFVLLFRLLYGREEVEQEYNDEEY
jgi:hypothetical protein